MKFVYNKVCMHGYTYTHIQRVCVYIYTYVCVCAYVCMHACMHACMYVSMYVCIYIYMYIQAHKGLQRSFLNEVCVQTDHGSSVSSSRILLDFEAHLASNRPVMKRA